MINFANSKILHYFCNRLRATIELWCNGNTADFGSVILSSNLGSSTINEGSQGEGINRINNHGNPLFFVYNTLIL